MKNYINKTLSLILSVILVLSVYVITDETLLATALENFKQEPMKPLAVGESYTFHFGEGDVIKTVANSTTSVDLDGNEFKPFMSQNGNGVDTAVQANIDTNGDGVQDASTLKLSLTGWNSVYIPTDANGHPLELEPNTTYTVSVKAYIEAKSAYGQLFPGGGVKSQYAKSPYTGGGIIYDNNSVYYGGNISSLRTGSSTFTTGDYQVSNGKFTLDDTEYYNYFYLYNGLCSEKFDGTNLAPSVIYIDSITITKTKAPTELGYTETYEFDTVKTSTSADKEGNSFTPFMSQNGGGTDTATQVNLDIDGDGTPETSTLKLSLTGWNSVYIPTDENGHPFVLEPNTTYTVSMKVYIEAKSSWGQFFIGGGAKSQYIQSPYKSGGMIYDDNMVYYGGELSSLRTASSTFTTGDYQASSGKFVLNGTEYLNYMYIFTGLCSEKFDGVNTTPSVVYIDSVTVTKTAQTANITFDANGGAFTDGAASLSAVQSVGENFTVEAPTTTQGGVFAGWSYTANGMPIHKVTSAMNGKTLYAIYKNPVNITLNANGGTFENSASVIETTQFDGVYLIYDAPTNNTDKFIGWATSPTATEKLASYKVTSAMEGTTLYAVWEKNPHGNYSTFERVVDYSKYTVNAWSGGNTWWAGGNSQYPWFSIVSDNTADGGKYLRFKTPHDDDESGALANDWLGAYGITMTASGSYNATGSGDENLYLPENTSYRVTLKIRTEDLSGGRMELYVAYGNLHHTANNQKTTLISEIGEMDEWTEISAVFTTPAEYNGANKLCFIGLTAGGMREFEYHIDSIKLEKVTATNIYTVQGGTATLEKTVYGVPGTKLTSEIKEEYYSSQDNTGYYKKVTLGGTVFANKELTEETIFKFANYDVDVYTDDFVKTVSGTENQDAYCGFDTYDNNDLAGFDVNCAEITDSMSYSGEKSLKINANTSTAFEIKNIDSLHLETGKTYKITLWYKSESIAKLAVGTVDAENLTSRSLEATEVDIANDFTKLSYLITPDKAYNEGYVPVIYAETGDSPLYIDNITVSSAVAFVGGYKTGNDDLRFVMSYKGDTEDGNILTIDGNEYTVVERGALVTGSDNTAAILEADTTSKGVKVVATTDLRSNFDFEDGTTLYSVLLDGINASDTYKFAARGYVKLSNGEIYYTEIVNMTASEAKIDTPTAKSTGEVLYNGIVIPEDWSGEGMENYGTEELPVPYLLDKPDVINIDVGRQLFVDDFLIANTNLNRTWHKAVEYEGNPIFKAETDIEKGLPYNDTYSHSAGAKPFSDGVWYDSEDGLYKMWYMAGSYYGTALATSKDGITWERAEYDVVPGTNLVLNPADTQVRDSNAIIINPFAKLKSEKYNMIQILDPTKIIGQIYTSADGIHWTYRTRTAALGDRTTMFYNPFRQKWVYSLRSYWHDRSRDYSESDSLVKGANLSGSVHWLRVDNKDLSDPVIGDKPQLYNFDAVAYESIMLGAFLIYQGPDNSITDATGIPKVTNIHLGFSRDGFHFSRSEDRTAFLSCSQKAGTWNRGYLTTNAGVCMVNDDELWFYYTGFAGDETLTNTDSVRSSGAYANGSTGLAKLRRDGFASMDGTGTLLTENITFSGKYLYVNANAEGGSVKAELLDEQGTVIPGYSVNDCVAVTEDTTKTMLSFGEGKDLSEFAAKNIKIRFYLDNAELYSFWVSTDAENGASNGYLAAGSVGQNGLIDTAESYK